jgi:hypothetical protein
MPFCRKCGRRLPEYSESCSECGTSTTAPMINIKKTSTTHKFKAAAQTKVAKAMIHNKNPISYKMVAQPVEAKIAPPAIAVKTVVQTKTAATPKPIVPEKQKIPTKPITADVVNPPHEIIKSNLSLKEDILANPRDYETQPFDFDLSCPNGHFWRAGKPLIVSNGKAFCLKCGELLRKPNKKKVRRYHRY